MPRFEAYADRCRTDWEARYGQSKPWAEHEEAYRYGWESALHDRYRDREYHEAESDLTDSWPKRFSAVDTTGTTGALKRTWEDLKETVREGYDRARMEFNKRT
ncbi:MAG: hypothetical protein HY332_05175 [Chloroflexi bacterium]|nr:hypothetical protein [Chloroflexota bacterium]